MRLPRDIASFLLRPTTREIHWIQVHAESAQAYHETVRCLVDDDGIERMNREWLTAVLPVSCDLGGITKIVKTYPK